MKSHFNIIIARMLKSPGHGHLLQTQSNAEERIQTHKQL